MKKIIFTLIMLSSFCYAVELDDLIEPKPFMGRFSNSDKVEGLKSSEKIELAPATSTVTKDTSKAEVKQAISKTEEETTTSDPISYADLSLKRLALDIGAELDLDSAKINSDLSILWAATTERSETMKYTIYKLSNPDEDKPNESIMKKILRPIANFSSVAGASVAGDPFVATGALIGGGLVSAFMKDDKEYNYKFSKVSDADMVLLVRKIDELQKKLLDLYVDYKTKEQLANMTRENFEKREEIYKNSQNKSKEELVIADVYYRTAKVNAQKAMDEYSTSRAILENLVGIEALRKIEE